MAARIAECFAGAISKGDLGCATLADAQGCPSTRIGWVEAAITALQLEEHGGAAKATVGDRRVGRGMSIGVQTIQASRASGCDAAVQTVALAEPVPRELRKGEG